MEFQGFQSAISPYLFALIAAILVFLAFVSYRKQSTLSLQLKILLSCLRATTFIVALLLLMNPFFFSSRTVEQKPRFIVLLDNSESTTISKGEYNGVQSYTDLLEDLALGEREDVDVDYFSFGSGSRQIQSEDSLDFSDPESNYIEAIAQILESESDYSASVLISDGIITFGRNPVISATELEIPIFTIGLGDTSKVRDIAINNIISNATGYTDTRHVVDVEISQNGFSNSESEIVIFNSIGESVASASIQFNTDEQVEIRRFEIPLDEDGLQPYRVEIQPLDDEWTNQNNSRTFSIDVLDSKTRILHINSEIHPDVKFVRSLLSTDPSIELNTLTWLGGNGFVEQEIPDFENLDLIILHGEITQIPLIELRDLIEQVPTVYLELPGTRRSFSNQSSYSLLRNIGSQVFELNLYPSSESDDHPILEFEEVNYSDLVPVLSSLRTEVIAPDATQLFGITFQGIETPNPLVAFSERGQIRRIHVSAWGWYRMYQSNNEWERDFISELFTNIVSWASNNPDNRRLKIEPAKSSFGSSEQVIINASLVNESGIPESDGAIEIHIFSENNEERVFNLSNLGGGNYTLSLESLNTGLFSFTATARKGSRIIDEQQGEFIVENSNAELVDIQRNDRLLTALANETDGDYYSFDAIDSFWADLVEKELLNSSTVSVDSYLFPIRSAHWFGLIILLLGAEWILRKYYSLP